MKFYSTSGKTPPVDFKTATIKGLAGDGGLYFPESIPTLTTSFITDLQKYSNEEIAFNVMHPYVGDISNSILFDIISETINFPFPLVNISESVSTLELFHGPTMAFKDVGARFMSRCLGHFMKNEDKQVTVLVATSGDTGGAVADGFYNSPGVNVVILYPAGKVSDIQEAQLTTHGKNIYALEINGSFDDCQFMVKKAFQDSVLNSKLFITSANSINISRWLPQQLYYFFGFNQWKEKLDMPIISVPCGNFGNLCAGVLAWKSGLPVKHFIASCNQNSAVSDFFNTGEFVPADTIHTISNAMDVGNPSNFVRLLQLFRTKQTNLKEMISCYSFSDVATKVAIGELADLNYLADPHGAIGYLGLKTYLGANKIAKGFFLETAHPSKFNAILENVLDKKIEVSDQTHQLLIKKRNKKNMGPNYEELRDYLLNKFI
ncbi:MAG: threonine synthase [Ginsengibacter sp.]